MSTDRALAIAAIRRFMDSDQTPTLQTYFYDVYFYSRGDIACKLIAPYRSESSTGTLFWTVPRPYLRVRRNWRTTVHAHGIDRLPNSPIAPNVLILHADEHWTFRGITTAKASWTPGGRKIVHGHLAWRVDEFEPGRVVAWAVGSSESRAIKKLARWPDTLRVHSDDADAFGEIVL